MTNLDKMFSAAQSQRQLANARSLAGTAELTAVSTRIANEILEVANDHISDFKDLIAGSKTDNNVMDSLIAKAYNLETVNVDFLRMLDDATIDGMLKSQQSKRSRAKSKVMTMENYKAMLVAAIAENLIRIATNRPKNTGSLRAASGDLTYTEEELEKFAADQEKLRREIRNIQSKKSIMKSKEGFSEEDERWQMLLKAEEQLKAIRRSEKVVVVDTTKERLIELLDGLDIHDLKNSEMKSLLLEIQELINDEYDEYDDDELEDNE